MLQRLWSLWSIDVKSLKRGPRCKEQDCLFSGALVGPITCSDSLSALCILLAKEYAHTFYFYVVADVGLGPSQMVSHDA